MKLTKRESKTGAYRISRLHFIAETKLYAAFVLTALVYLTEKELRLSHVESASKRHFFT